MQVLPARAIGLEVSSASERQGGLVRWPEVSRATEEPRDVLCKYVQHFPRRVPPGNSLCIGRKNRESMIPPGWEFPPLHELDFVRQLGILTSICFELLRPRAVQTRAACAYASCEMLVHPIRNEKFFILGPSVVVFYKPDLIVAQRFTMSR